MTRVLWEISLFENNSLTLSLRHPRQGKQALSYDYSFTLRALRALENNDSRTQDLKLYLKKFNFNELYFFSVKLFRHGKIDSIEFLQGGLQKRIKHHFLTSQSYHIAKCSLR